MPQDNEYDKSMPWRKMPTWKLTLSDDYKKLQPNDAMQYRMMDTLARLRNRNKVKSND